MVGAKAVRFENAYQKTMKTTVPTLKQIFVLFFKTMFRTKCVCLQNYSQKFNNGMSRDKWLQCLKSYHKTTKTPTVKKLLPPTRNGRGQGRKQRDLPVALAARLMTGAGPWTWIGVTDQERSLAGPLLASPAPRAARRCGVQSRSDLKEGRERVEVGREGRRGGEGGGGEEWVKGIDWAKLRR